MKTASRIVAVAFLLTLLVNSLPAQAQGTASGVFYDYTRVTFGGVAQFALIPRETDAFRQDGPVNVSVPEAFRVLRDRKRATYGNASLTLTDDDIAQGRVVVHIDPDQVQWFQIVAAETVYTFTGLGVNEVVFPGISEEPWTRAQVPFAAFVLHMPMWRALPPARVTGAVIELFDGSSLTSAEFYRRWADGDRELQRQVFDYLGDGTAIEQRGVLSALADLEISGADTAVVGVLESDNEAIRLMAIEYLAARGAGMDRIAELVDTDPSAEVRAAAAQALGGSGDTQYAYLEVLHNLSLANDSQRAQALSDLISTSDPRAVEELIPYLASERSDLRRIAMDGLIILNAEDRLVSAMNDESLRDEVRQESAWTLVVNSDADGRLRALEFLVSSQTGTAALTSLERLSQDDGIDLDRRREALEAQLTHPDQVIRAAAAQILTDFGETESLTALSRAAAAEAVPTVVEAFERSAISLILLLPAAEVRDLAEGRDLFLKRASFQALGQLAHEGRASQSVFRTLVEGVEDREPVIRGAAVLGLAAYANDEAFEVISGLSDDDSVSVRRDTARALGSFPAGQGSDLLLALMADSDPAVVGAALESLGARGESDHLPEALGLTQSESDTVRCAAAVAAGRLATPETQQTTIDALMGLTNDSEATVRAAAARALGNFDSDLAILGISPLTQDRMISVQLAAIEALGSTGNRTALGLLSSLLGDPNPEIRIAALHGLGTLGMPDAVPAIQAAMDDEPVPVVVEIGQAVIEQLNSGSP